MNDAGYYGRRVIVTCKECGAGAVRAEVVFEAGRRNRKLWYENGYSQSNNPGLPHDYFFAVCPDCRSDPDDAAVMRAHRVAAEWGGNQLVRDK